MNQNDNQTQQDDNNSVAITIDTLESSIKNYLLSIEAKKKEVGEYKEQVSDAFDNNPAYFQSSEKVKEANLELRKIADQIASTGSVIAAKNQIKDLTLEVRELENAISKLLLKYAQISGKEEFTTTDGQIFDIVTTARLKRKK